jgi:hypothetical protein
MPDPSDHAMHAIVLAAQPQLTGITDLSGRTQTPFRHQLPISLCSARSCRSSIHAATEPATDSAQLSPATEDEYAYLMQHEVDAQVLPCPP